jgi:hypothetical protein
MHINLTLIVVLARMRAAQCLTSISLAHQAGKTAFLAHLLIFKTTGHIIHECPEPLTKPTSPTA